MSLCNTRFFAASERYRSDDANSPLRARDFNARSLFTRDDEKIGRDCGEWMGRKRPPLPKAVKRKLL
jgi:hypothetical protein